MRRTQMWPTQGSYINFFFSFLLDHMILSPIFTYVRRQLLPELSFIERVTIKCYYQVCKKSSCARHMDGSPPWSNQLEITVNRNCQFFEQKGE